jgi:hypothetical protein
MTSKRPEFGVIKVECTKTLQVKFKETCRMKDTNMSTELIKMVKKYVREFEDSRPKGNIF